MRGGIVVSAALVAALACVRNDDNRLELYVDALISDEGSLADQAERALIARGREAIVIVETGLYRADSRGRRRIIRVLDAIEGADAVPLLTHVATYDTDEDVAAAARAALERRSIKPPERQVYDAGATPATPASGCTPEPRWREVFPGVTFAEVLLESPAALPGGDPCLVAVRIDLQHASARVLSALPDPGRSAEDWLASESLLAAINAGLYLPSGVPTGLTIAGERELNGKVNRTYSGFLAFGPRREGVAAAVITGSDCAGFDLAALRRDYHNIVQAARLLDCSGKAVPWADARPHSAAVIGVDRDGRFVLVHVQALYRMADLARELERTLSLRGALFVEGGSEAQLAVRAGEFRWSRSGGYGFALGLSAAGSAEKIPNIIGFDAR